MTSIQEELLHLARSAAIGILSDLEKLSDGLPPDPQSIKNIRAETRIRQRTIRTAMKGLS